MAVDLAGKRVLVLSDDDGLSRAIEFNLKSHQGIVGCVLSGSGQPADPSEIGNCDLIVVAMSSVGSDPVAALSRASLDAQIGRVPMLIISAGPFHSPGDRVVHLDFPFEIDDLYDKIKETLQEKPLVRPKADAPKFRLVENGRKGGPFNHRRQTEYWIG